MYCVFQTYLRILLTVKKQQSHQKYIFGLCNGFIILENVACVVAWIKTRYPPNGTNMTQYELVLQRNPSHLSYLSGKCGVLHIQLQNTQHSSDFKLMPERSEARKSVKSIVSATCISYLERIYTNTSTYITNQR